MTIWDKIYKDFKKGEEAWATLKEGVLPVFSNFVENNKFKFKDALDIGCGTGKYLVYLKDKGFCVSGIDSSETAIEMSKKLVSKDSKIENIDMFKYNIADNKHDLIFSISTIHHGLKKDVSGLVNQIYKKLKVGGFVFITLPDIDSHKKWETFKGNNEISPGTYTPTSGPEKGLAHSFFSKEEIKKMFSNFKNLNIYLDEKGKWNITAHK